MKWNCLHCRRYQQVGHVHVMNGTPRQKGNNIWTTCFLVLAGYASHDYRLTISQQLKVIKVVRGTKLVFARWLFGILVGVLMCFRCSFSYTADDAGFPLNAFRNDLHQCITEAHRHRNLPIQCRQPLTPTTIF